MTYTLVHLELADWNVARSARQVMRQREFLKALTVSGRDTAQAKVVLAGFEEALMAYRARRDQIREALDTQREQQSLGLRPRWGTRRHW